MLEKRQGRAFEQAMIESLMDDIYEAQAAAESESLLFQNSLSGSDTGWKFSSPRFLLSHPKIDDRSEHYQHQIPQLKKDKAKARRESGRRPGLGQQETHQDQQPQIPTERETETGCHRGRCQQTPCLPVLPAKNWPLPHRAIPPVDGQTPGHEMLVVPVQHPDP